MATKTLHTIIQLRRDTEENYDIIKDSFIPRKGEVVLVDTASKGLRSKVGDGVTTYANLDFSDDALDLKALAHKDSASGTIETVDTADSITVAKAGEYTISGNTIEVPVTYNALDVSPDGSVDITAETEAAATYQKTSSITVSSEAVEEGQTANYTPAGSISLPAINAGINLTSTDVATVTDNGTAYTITDGSVNKGDDITAKFVKKAINFTVDDAEEELVFSFVENTDNSFYDNAVTATGSVTYTAPVLSGSLPTFGTQAVALTTGATATADYDGAAVFNGTGVIIDAVPSYITDNATITQPTFTATFTGTTKTVTPTVATTSNALTSGSITVGSETKSITLNKKSTTITVS